MVGDYALCGSFSVLEIVEDWILEFDETLVGDGCGFGHDNWKLDRGDPDLMVSDQTWEDCGTIGSKRGA